MTISGPDSLYPRYRLSARSRLLAHRYNSAVQNESGVFKYEQLPYLRWMQALSDRTGSRCVQEPWRPGLAVGSGAVERACKQVIHRRFKRAGMRWKQPGVLSVLTLWIAHLNETFQAFWASRDLTV
jgi:hypothetical protein